jgi:hypothetical protein
MKEAYYKQILGVSPEKPELVSLKPEGKFPDNWPVLVESIIEKTDNILKFKITDLKTTMVCVVNNKAMLNKLTSIQAGQVVFLYDASLKLNPSGNVVDIIAGRVYSLKEVNDGIPQTEASKQKSTPKKRVIKVNLNKFKNADRTAKPKIKKETYGSYWRTLSERWQNQGKISE